MFPWVLLGLSRRILALSIIDPQLLLGWLGPRPTLYISQAAYHVHPPAHMGDNREEEMRRISEDEDRPQLMDSIQLN